MLTWKSHGCTTPFHVSECERFLVEPCPRGYVAYRFDDVEDVVPVEESDIMPTCQQALAWCEARATLEPVLSL